MFNYLNIMIVCLTEEQKINVIISIMSRKKVRQNNTKVHINVNLGLYIAK